MKQKQILELKENKKKASAIVRTRSSISNPEETALIRNNIYIASPPQILSIKNSGAKYLLDHLYTAMNVFDHQTQKFIWVNKLFNEISGLTEEECYSHRIDEFSNWIDENDLHILQNELTELLQDTCHKNIKDKSQQLAFTYNFWLNGKAGKQTCLLSHSSVLQWDENFLPAVSLNVLTDITHRNPGHKICFSICLYDDISLHWKNVLTEEFLRIPSRLTKREKEILSYMLLDKSARKISEEKNMSFFTVRSHWRNILQKTNCPTIKDLKQLAQKEGWM